MRASFAPTVELRAEELVVQLGECRALDRVSLALSARGQALVLGDAGSGKTTLLKALAGLVHPTSGRVLWDGVDAERLGPVERRARQAAFGMVFQSDALFDSLTVLENVTLPLTRRKVPAPEARERALAVLAEVGLLDAAERLPDALSGGMRKRAGLARAIVARPEVILADDPLAGLDPATAASISELLLGVAAGRMLIVAAPEPPATLALPREIQLSRGAIAHDRSRP